MSDPDGHTHDQLDGQLGGERVDAELVARIVALLNAERDAEADPSTANLRALADETVDFMRYLEALGRTQRYVGACIEHIDLRLRRLEAAAGFDEPMPRIDDRLRELNRQLAALAPRPEHPAAEPADHGWDDGRSADDGAPAAPVRRALGPL